MKKRSLFLFIVTIHLIACNWAYSEENKTSLTPMPVEAAVDAMKKNEKQIDPKQIEELTGALDALKKYQDAMIKQYEEMGKHQEPYYTYDRSLIGGVAFIGDKLESGVIPIYFILNNSTKTAFDVRKAGYFGIGKIGNIVRLEFGGVVYNEDEKNSMLANPEKEVQLGCETSFRDYAQAKSLREVYIKIHGKRVYFVREKYHKIYLKPTSVFFRSLRDNLIDLLQMVLMQLRQSKSDVNITNFVKDYIRFISVFSSAVDELKKGDLETELEGVKAISKYNYEMTEASKYLKPYLKNKNNDIRAIANTYETYIRDMEKYLDGGSSSNKDTNAVQAAVLSGKGLGAQNLLIKYLDTATLKILELMSAHPYSDKQDASVSKLNDKQLVQIINEIDTHYGSELKKLDYQNKDWSEFKLDKFLWAALYIKNYAENALLQNSKDKQP